MGNIYIIKASKHFGPCITIKKKKNESNIMWSIFEEKLDYSLQILSYIIESDTPGHQHLDEGDALIELSYKET